MEMAVLMEKWLYKFIALALDSALWGTFDLAAWQSLQ